MKDRMKQVTVIAIFHFQRQKKGGTREKSRAAVRCREGRRLNE